MASKANELSHQHSSHFRWQYIMPILFITQMVGMFDKVNVGIAMAFKPFLKAMHLVNQPVLLSLLASLYLIAYGISQPIWGALADRIGARIVALIGMIIWFCMLILAGFATNATMMFISRIGLGFGGGVLWPIGNSLLARWYPLNERSRAQAVWVNGINIGVGLCFLFTMLVLLTLGWRAMFFSLAIIGLIPLVLFLIVVRDDPRKVKRVNEAEAAYIEAGQLAKSMGKQGASSSIFSSWVFWFTSISFIAACMQIWGYATWVPSFLTKARGMPISHMGLSLGVIWLLVTLILFPVGAWSDRLMVRAPFAAVAFFLFGAALYAAGLIHNLAVDLVLLWVAAASQMVGTMAVFALMHSIAKAHQMGKAAGIMTGLGNVVAALGPLVMGALIGKFGDFTSSFLFIAIISLAGAILLAILIPQELASAPSTSVKVSAG